MTQALMILFPKLEFRKYSSGLFRYCYTDNVIEEIKVCATFIVKVTEGNKYCLCVHNVFIKILFMSCSFL